MWGRSRQVALRSARWEHGLDIGATAASFAATLAVQVWSVPMLLDILGAQQFSVFQIIVALLGWTVLAPLGCDRALKNLLSRSRAQNAVPTDILIAARSVAWLLFLGGGIIILVFGQAFGSLLLSSLANAPRGLTFSLALIAMLLFGIGNIGRELLFAARRGRWVSAIHIANMTSILLFLTLLYDRTKAIAPDWLIALALVTWLTPHALAGLAALTLSGVLRPPPAMRWTAIRALRGPAGRFFLFSLATTALIASDYPILAHLGTPADVVLYTLCSRVTNAFILLLSGILALYWPQWTEQFARGQGEQVRKRVVRMVAGWTALAVALGSVLLVGFEPACRIWLQNPALVIPVDTVLWMGAALVARIWHETFVTALLAASRPGLVTAVIMIQAGLAITAQVMLYPWYGVNALFVGIVLGTLLSSAWLLPLILRRLTKPPGYCLT